MKRPVHTFSVPFLALGLGLAACGSGDGSGSDSDSTATTVADTVDATTAETTNAGPEAEATTSPPATTDEVSDTSAPATTAMADTENEASSPDSQPSPEAMGPVVINSPGLFPEGLSYDPVGTRFIIGSLLTGQLLAVSDDGTTTPFADSPGAHLTGVEADPDRDRLLVAVTGLPNGEAKLSIHDLATGEQQSLIDLATAAPDAAQFANGIAIGDDGTAYVTNTAGGLIYAVDGDGNPSVFSQSEMYTPVQDGTATGLNGIVYHDGALIVGHAATGKLLRVSLDDPNTPVEIETGVDMTRIDGLHLSDDGGTLAVATNVGAVHIFGSDDRWRTANELSSEDLGSVFPTSVTDRDGTFYVLQAHLDQMRAGADTFEIVPIGG